ncbi:type II toxin-antitoxin system YoeB family toxin [Desulfobulbus sp.]
MSQGTTWSRRIDGEHRLAHEVHDDKIRILVNRSHY